MSLIDCDHRTPPAADSGFPYIAIPQLRNGHVDPTDARRITREHFEDWTRRARPGQHDVVLSRRCNPGETAVAPPGLEFALGQNLVLLRADGTQLFPPFLRWLVRGPEWWDQIAKFINVGAVFDSLRCADVPNLELKIPPLPEQRAIAGILGALDDKIELNRRMSETLEAIARSIFKSWFVDFDPVRAKRDGRDPEGVPPEVADLFPSEFEDSELGEIPKGWRINTLAEHVTAERGLSYKGAGLCGHGEGRPMHNLNSVYEGGGYKYPGIKFYSGNFKERHLASAGDIIVANTEQGHEHRLIGFPAIIPAIYPEGLFSHHLYRVRLHVQSPLTQHTLYYMLMAPYVREQIIGCANGSTVNMLKSAGLEIPRFVCPPGVLASAFEDLAKPIHQRIEQNIRQAEELEAIRDTLLPRLMSGKLHLPESVSISEVA